MCVGGADPRPAPNRQIAIETTWQDFRRRCGIGKSRDLVQARGYGFRKRLSLQETLLAWGRAGGECKGQSSWGLGQERGRQPGNKSMGKFA